MCDKQGREVLTFKIKYNVVEIFYFLCIEEEVLLYSEVKSEKVSTKNISYIENSFKIGNIITFILAIVGNILLVLSLITNVICAKVLCGKLLVI